MVSRHSPTTSTLASSLFVSQTFPIFSFVFLFYAIYNPGRVCSIVRSVDARQRDSQLRNMYIPSTQARSRSYKGHVRTVNLDGDNFIIVCHRSVARSVKHGVPIALARAHCDNLTVDRPRCFAISTRVNSAIRAPRPRRWKRLSPSKAY